MGNSAITNLTLGGAVALRDEIVAIYNDGQLTDAQKITNIMAVVDERT